MLDLGRLRRHEGALDPGLLEDVAKPGRYLETLVVESRGEHLRHHECATVADHQILELARSCHLPEGPPTASHLLYAYDQET